MNATAKPPFWKTKTLEEMNRQEWESLCDGCGQCCMHKLRDFDTDELYLTSVACTLLDPNSGQCSNYPGRKKKVPDCIFLTPEIVHSVDWLPKTCAYKLIADGQDLYDWHPLISGDPETVHQAGISVRGKIRAFDHEIKEESDYLPYLVGPMD